jgi:hypothetical protein
LPSLFPAGDVRDTGAALKNAIDQEPGSGLQLFAAGIGFIPFFGDGMKFAIKGGKGVVRQAIKRLRNFFKNPLNKPRKRPRKRVLERRPIKRKMLLKKQFLLQGR